MFFMGSFRIVSKLLPMGFHFCPLFAFLYIQYIFFRGFLPFIWIGPCREDRKAWKETGEWEQQKMLETGSCIFMSNVICTGEQLQKSVIEN